MVHLYYHVLLPKCLGIGRGSRVKLSNFVPNTKWYLDWPADSFASLGALISIALAVLIHTLIAFMDVWTQTNNSKQGLSLTVLLFTSPGFFILQVLEKIRSQMQNGTSLPPISRSETDYDQAMVGGCFTRFKNCLGCLRKQRKEHVDEESANADSRHSTSTTTAIPSTSGATAGAISTAVTAL